MIFGGFWGVDPGALLLESMFVAGDCCTVSEATAAVSLIGVAGGDSAVPAGGLPDWAPVVLLIFPRVLVYCHCEVRLVAHTFVLVIVKQQGKITVNLGGQNDTVKTHRKMHLFSCA